MHDALSDLLQAELEAEKVVQESEQRREEIKQQAIEEANSNIAQFNRKIPELHHF